MTNEPQDFDDDRTRAATERFQFERTRRIEAEQRAADLAAKLDRARQLLQVALCIAETVPGVTPNGSGSVDELRHMASEFIARIADSDV